MEKANVYFVHKLSSFVITKLQNKHAFIRNMYSVTPLTCITQIETENTSHLCFCYWSAGHTNITDLPNICLLTNNKITCAGNYTIISPFFHLKLVSMKLHMEVHNCLLMQGMRMSQRSYISFRTLMLSLQRSWFLLEASFHLNGKTYIIPFIKII